MRISTVDRVRGWFRHSRSSSSMNYVSQTDTSRRPALVWLAVSAVSLLILSSIVVAPIAAASGYNSIAKTIYLAFGPLCHQNPARSFFVHSHPFAVCARCTGLYGGFALAALVYPLVRSLRQTQTPGRRGLFVAAAPMAIDVGLDVTGVWQNTHFSRFATGLLLGAVVVFYLIPALVEVSFRNWKSGRERRADPLTMARVHPNAASAPSDYSAPHRRI